MPKILLCRSQNLSLAVCAESIEAVIPIRNQSTLPKVPSYCSEVQRYRGKTLCLIQYWRLFQYLGLNIPQTTELTSAQFPLALICQHPDGLLGLPVDDVTNFCTIDIEQIRPIVSTGKPSKALGQWQDHLYFDPTILPAIIADLTEGSYRHAR